MRSSSSALRTLAPAILLAATGSAFAQPANDSHVNAITVTMGSLTAGTNVAATANAAIPVSCGAATTALDVWYRYDAADSGDVQFSLCTSATNWNSVIIAYLRNPDGTPGNVVACDDDACSSTSHAALIMPVTGGQSYLLRIMGKAAANTGAFTLNVTKGAPQAPIVRAVGTDAVIGKINDMTSYGTATVDSRLVRAVAIGSVTWNIGDRPLAWFSTTAEHPVWGQNLYRGVGKRFDHVGLGWAKKGFAVGNGTFDATFGSCVTSGIGGSHLGVNCSDTYGASTNGGQTNLSPRFSIDPTTGVLIYPFSTMIPASSGNVMRRCQLLDSDIQPATNPGAAYYGEVFIFGADDSGWGNSRNNFSSRKLGTLPALTSGSQTITLTGPTLRNAAIEIWAAETPGVSVSRIDLLERNKVWQDKWQSWEPGETTIAAQSPTIPTARDLFTRYIVTSGATDNGNGTWTYDYAILNINSSRAGGSFTLRMPVGGVTGKEFRAPFYHSGDRYRNVPWLSADGTGRVGWRVDPATEVVNVSGVGNVIFEPNALMFGTAYSFRFTCAVPPGTGVGRLGLFRAPIDGTGYQGSSLAISGLVVPQMCPADIGQQGGIPGADGNVDNNDFVVFLDAFFGNDLLLADTGKQGGVPGADNVLDNNDFIVFIDDFFAPCP